MAKVNMEPNACKLTWGPSECNGRGFCLVNLKQSTVERNRLGTRRHYIKTFTFDLIVFKVTLGSFCVLVSNRL